MIKPGWTLLGRDAGDILDSGPAYYKTAEGKLISILEGAEEELEPDKAVKILREKNNRLAKAAQDASDAGDWLPLQRQRARERLIWAIIEAFYLEQTGENDNAKADGEK